MKSPCETTDRDFDSGTAVVRIDIKLLEPLIQIFNFGDYYLDNGMIPQYPLMRFKLGDWENVTITSIKG